jgi:hypothetical protein
MKGSLLPFILMLLVVSCGKDDLAEDAVMLQFSANDADWLLTRGADYTGDTGANPLSDMLVYGYYTGDDAWLSTTRNPAFPLCAPCMSRAHLLQATVKFQNYK